MDELFDLLSRNSVRHSFFWQDEASGLRAIGVMDDLTLGPAAGGIRTQPYPSLRHALEDANELARTMTVKCALAGLKAGGGKIVVLEPNAWNREAAFAALGERLQDLAGRFQAGGDLGTTPDDLACAAQKCDHVHADVQLTTSGVGRSVLACLRAAVHHRDPSRNISDLHVAIQGCGAIGKQVALALTGAGARCTVTDHDEARAKALAAEIGATVVSTEDIYQIDADVFSPCGSGKVITSSRASELKAWAICGGANNPLAGETVGAELVQRNILFVPDVISSAGAVIQGVSSQVMGIKDPTSLIDALEPLTGEILSIAGKREVSPLVVADERAQQILRAAR